MAERKEIRRRAYEIYLERGEQPGGELDDWLWEVVAQHRRAIRPA